METQGRVFMARQELTQEQARLTALMKSILQKQQDLDKCQKQLDADNTMRKAVWSAILDKAKQLKSANANVQKCT